MLGARSIPAAAGLAALGFTFAWVGVTGVAAEEAPRWAGRWDVEARLTIEPRTGAAVAVAPGIPHGVVVWGGIAEDGRLLRDGVLIDSRDPYRWRTMPEAPLVARRDFGWASDGDRAYVWGGVDEDGEPLGDGAEYQHGWTILPEGPLPAGPASMAVVDSRLWVVAIDPETDRARIASLGVPVEDHRGWGWMADVPLPAGDRYVVIGCCGDEADQLIVLSIREGRPAVAASWDIGAARTSSFIGGAWTQLGTVPVPIAGPVVGRAVERELAAWVGSADDGQPGEPGADDVVFLRAMGYRADDRWRTPPAPGGLRAGSNLVLSPRHLISVSDLAAYDLADERWLRLPQRHRRARFGTPSGATACWDRGRLWVFGGVAPDGTMRSDLWSFTPRLPRHTYALPIGWAMLYRGSDDRCYFIGKPGTWRLRADRLARPRVWMQQGRRQVPLRMPDGWHADFGPRLTISDPTGAVRYREGEPCRGTTGTGG